MNILFVAFDYPPLKGGIATVSYQVAKNLSKEDRLIIVAPAIKGAKKFDRESKFVAFRVTNIKGLREFVLFFTMLYLVTKFRIDVIYNLTWYPQAAVSYFVTVLTNVPYVIHVYAADYFEDRRGFLNKLKYNWFKMLIKRLAFDRAKKIITISNFTKDRLITRGVDALKIKIVFCGVDPGHFKPGLDAKGIISKYGLENKKVLLTVSRLDDYKGHDMVIKALPKLITRFPDIRYLIVGTGPNEKNLKELVEKLSLSDYVIFTGWQDALLPLHYNACDIFIMLSREVYAEAKVEGFGIVFLEANACAKPVIGGKSGGIEDAVVDQVTGILVDPLNLDEIVGAVTKILNDKRYAEQLGANGLNRIKRERLDWYNVSKKIREVIIEAKR